MIERGSDLRAFFRAHARSAMVGMAAIGVVVAGLPVLAQAAAAAEPTAETGGPVEVLEARDEYSQTFANPDGTFRLVESVAPQRVRAADGTWVAPDASLAFRADGSVGPRAAVVGLSFSGGGEGAGVVRLESGGRGVALDWSGRLPKPQLSGDTAVYPEVLPGVDLRLTATVEGYQQVLVVKTAEAATNPELARLRWAVRASNVRLSPAAGGGVRAVDEDGNAVFSGPAGLMWDSAGDSPAGGSGVRGRSVPRPALEANGPAADGGTGDPADGPGPGDRTAEMPVQVGTAEMAVVPDAALLRDAVFPLYIDPLFGFSASRRTVVTSNGHAYWQFDNDRDPDTDVDHGRGVGRCSSKTISGRTYVCSSSAFSSRMFFTFERSRLAGKKVLDATFRLTETWSFSCKATEVDLYRTKTDITSATRWPGPATLDKLGDRSVSHGRGSACSPSQPAAPVEFNDNPGEADENLTSTVQKLASGAFPRLTVMLKAADEGDAESWKRFKNDATLQVTYYPAPGLPTGVGVQANNDPKSVTCRDQAHKITVGDPTPLVRATVQTQVQPAKGEDKGQLRAQFEVQAYDAASKTWKSAWNGIRPTSAWLTDGGGASVATGFLKDGTDYRLGVRTQSHTTFGGKSQDTYSGYSSWCYFRVDSTAPRVPLVTPVGPYQACEANDCPAAGGPGVPGEFAFEPAAGDTDIAGYRWQLSAVDDGGAPKWSGEIHEISGSRPHEKAVIPPFGGPLVLTVEARDSLRYGPPRTVEFNVAVPPGPVGRWQFGENGGTSAEAHPLTLAGGAELDERGRRGNVTGDRSLAGNGVSGYATTGEPVVNTAQSYTIAGWAYLTDLTKPHSIAGQGDGGAGFNLAFQPGRGWVFGWHATAAGATSAIRSQSQSAAVPQRVWTHVAGVYSAENHTIQVFVNGRPQGSPVAMPAAQLPVTTSGPLEIGRGGDGAAPTDYFAGLVDEVTVWQRALAEEELRTDAQVRDGDGAPATALVGSWLSGDAGTATADVSGYGRPGLTLSSSAMDPDTGALRLDGVVGYASLPGPVLDETGSFTVTAQVLLDPDELAKKPNGYVAQVVGQQAGGESSWRIWYEQDSVTDGVPQGHWCFGRTSAQGTTVAKVSVAFANTAADAVTQVTGVYDAGEDSLNLYVGEEPQTPDESVVVASVLQGGDEFSVGRGRRAGGWGDHLPGEVGDLRVWAGAMTRKQIATQVLGLTADAA